MVALAWSCAHGASIMLCSCRTPNRVLEATKCLQLLGEHEGEDAEFACNRHLEVRLVLLRGCHLGEGLAQSSQVFLRSLDGHVLDAFLGRVRVDEAPLDREGESLVAEVLHL